MANRNFSPSVLMLDLGNIACRIYDVYLYMKSCRKQDLTLSSDDMAIKAKHHENGIKGRDVHSGQG